MGPTATENMKAPQCLSLASFEQWVGPLLRLHPTAMMEAEVMPIKMLMKAIMVNPHLQGWILLRARLSMHTKQPIGCVR